MNSKTKTICWLLIVGGWGCYVVGKPVVVVRSPNSVAAASVPSTGTTINVSFTQTTTGTEETGWTVTASGGAVTVSSGTGSGSISFALTLSRTIEAGETITLAYTPGDLTRLKAFSGFQVTNLSEQGAPDPDVPGEEPELQIDPPVFTLTGQAINYTPTVTQGEDVEFSATGLPTGASINATTGNVTGTLSTHGTGVMKITGTNTVGSFTIAVPWQVYDTTTTINAAWLAANDGGTGPWYLDGNYTYWVVDNAITTELTSDGTLFALHGDFSALDLNGKTGTYNNATPISIGNASFETVDAIATRADLWDWTNVGSTGAVRNTGTFLNNECFDPSPETLDQLNAIKFVTTTATGYISSESTITLLPNTSYVLSAHLDYGGATNPSNPGVVTYVSLVGTGGESTVTASKSTQNTRGIQLVETVFVTGAGTPTYNVRVGITGHASATLPAYIDNVKVIPNFRYGVAVGSNGSSPTQTPDLAEYFGSNDCIVANGTLVSGQEGAWCHGLWTRNALRSSFHGLDITVQGNNGSCVNGTAAGTGHVTFHNIDCTFTNNTSAVTSRDNLNGATCINSGGWYSDNTLVNGPIAGIYNPVTTAGVATALRNTCTMTNKYTNGFAIHMPGPNIIQDNVIDSDAGSYSGRGIGADGGTISGNVVAVQTLANNQEYSGTTNAGVLLGAQYAFQTEHIATDMTIENETYTIKGGFGGKAFRLSKDDGGIVTARNCTFICDVSQQIPLPGSDKHASALYISDWDEAESLVFEDNTVTTNATALLFDAGPSEVLLSDTHWEYIDDGITLDFPWIIGFSNTQVYSIVIQNPTYEDAGTKTWMDQFPVGVTGLAITGSNTTVIVQHEITATLTNGMTPLNTVAVVVTDAQDTEVFNGNTNASGEITFTAKEWTRAAAVNTRHNPYTITATGYDPEDVTLDETDHATPPTIPLTPE
jgi:hypothetical protein